MKSRSIHCLLIAIALFVPASFTNAEMAGCQQNPDIQMVPPLVSNGFFEVVNRTTLRFEEGVYWEVVKTVDGREVIRYGADKFSIIESESALVCRCGTSNYTPCSGECKVTITGGNATCRGGCYEEAGTECLSCRFYLDEEEGPN